MTAAHPEDAGGLRSGELIAPGTATAVDLGRGDELVVTSPDGGQGGDLSFRGFDQAVTRNANGWERFGRPWLVFWVERGMRLFDGDANPILEVGPSRGSGRSDVMYPGCWREIYPDGRPGCRDLIAEALGMERGELTGMLSFFVNAEVEDGVYKGLGECPVEPGDFVSFRALEPVRVAVSACPDDGIPGWRPAPLLVDVRS